MQLTEIKNPMMNRKEIAEMISVKGKIIDTMLLMKRQASRVFLLPKRSDAIPVKGLPAMTPAI